MAHVGFTVAQKAKAAGIYAMTGNIEHVAREIGCSKQSIYEWLKHPEFVAMIDTALKEQSLRIKRGMGDVVDKCIEVLADRIENGDEIYVSGGKDMPAMAVRRKISAKDAAIVAAVCVDKLAIIAKMEQGGDVVDDRVQKMLDRLDKLADNRIVSTVHQVPENNSDIVPQDDTEGK